MSILKKSNALTIILRIFNIDDLTSTNNPHYLNINKHQVYSNFVKLHETLRRVMSQMSESKHKLQNNSLHLFFKSTTNEQTNK